MAWAAFPRALIHLVVVLQFVAGHPILIDYAIPVSIPNTTLQLTGAELAGVSSLVFCPLPNGKCVTGKPVVAYSYALVAVNPFVHVVPFNITACDPTGCSSPVSVNLPRVLFLSSVGGSAVRVFGRALSFTGDECVPLTASADPESSLSMWMENIRRDPNPTVIRNVYAGLSVAHPQAFSGSLTLVGSSNTAMVLNISLASCYRVDGVLPASLPAGEYESWLNNGLLPGLGVRAGTVSLLGPPAPNNGWPSTVYTLGVNCSTVMLCLQAAHASGGGIVRLPPGAFTLPPNAALDVSGGLQLVGAGQQLTFLSWPSNTVGSVPSALLTCAGFGAVRDLTLNVTSPVTTAILFSPNSTSCSLRDVTVWVDYSDAMNPVGNAFLANSSVQWTVTGSTVFHRGNCSAPWPLNTAYFVILARDAEMSNNTVICGCQGFSVQSSVRVVFDSMRVVSIGDDSQGDGYSSFQSPNVLEHVYVGRGVDIGNPGATRRWESMTFDGSEGMYVGYVLPDPSGNTSVFNVTFRPSSPKGLAPEGLLCVVMDGTGLGQVSRVVSASHNLAQWVVSPPFTIPLLPNDSVVSIVPYRGGILFEGNTWLNGTTVQLYGTAVDVSAVGNYLQRMTSGLETWGLYYNGGFQPNFYVLFERNTLRCCGGLATLGGLPSPPPVEPLNFTGFFNRFLIFRGNDLVAGSNIRIQDSASDVVLEGNRLTAGLCDSEGPQKAAGGVYVKPPAQHVLQRDTGP